MHSSLDSLLAPYPALLTALTDTPCGPDLEYDPQYLELFIKLIPKETKTVGGEAGSEKLESALEPLRWTEIEHDCLALMQRTRDARLAAIFVRCRVQQAQWQGLLEGLALTLTLLRSFPSDLHPSLTQEGEHDVLPRADALSSLADQEGLLDDIRGLPVDDGNRLRVQLRDVERALTRVHPDNVLPPDAARRMLTDMRQRGAPHCLALLDALELASAIAAETHEDLGDALRLHPLLDLLQTIAAAAQGTRDAPPSGADDKNPMPQDEGIDGALSADAATAQAPRVSGAQTRILHRNEARERIREARLWFEEHEPSSPVSLLLRKAEHLVGKRFAEVVDTLPGELLERWEQEQ